LKEVIVPIGAGQIGQAIARRVGVAMHILLGDMRPENANAAAEVLGTLDYRTPGEIEAEYHQEHSTLAIAETVSLQGQRAKTPT